MIVDFDMKTLGPGRHEVRIFVSAEPLEAWRRGTIVRHYAGRLALFPGRKPGETAGRWLRLELERFRRQGVATEAYRQVGARLLELGETLTNAMPDVRLSAGAQALWGPLVRAGCTVEAVDDQGRTYFRLERPKVTEEAKSDASP